MTTDRTRPPTPRSSPRLPPLAAGGALVLAALACSRGSPPAPGPADGPIPSPTAALDAVVDAPTADATPSTPEATAARDGASAEESDRDDGGTERTGPVDAGPERPPGSMADLDRSNDLVTGPPDPIPDCDARLDAADIRWAAADLPIRRLRNGDVCGVDRAVNYREGPTGIRWSPHPVASCGLALALARFETIAQEEAERFLDSRITRVEQGGTTACRRIARFPGMMSEHSYANGIDVRSFQLADGRTITVKRFFGKTDEEPVAPEGRFLRSLARRLYDEDVFSCVLTAFWDHRHDDHFHLDLARYRVDGTR